MELNILLCDDEQEAIFKFSTQIESCAKKQQVNIRLLCFPSGESLLYEFMESGLTIDILYLDIVMKELDGMETAKKLRAAGCTAPIIFLTSSEEYVYDAFDVDAVQYLLKEELTHEKFEQAFQKAVKRITLSERPMFSFTFNRVKTAAPIAQITYFEIWKRIVTVHYNGTKKKFYGSMDQLEEELRDSNFVRCHRSYLVYLPAIVEFGHSQIVLTCGTHIPIGATYYSGFCTAFSRYAKQTRSQGGDEK